MTTADVFRMVLDLALTILRSLPADTREQERRRAVTKLERAKLDAAAQRMLQERKERLGR